jgi:thiamine biosynthesis lipoprotein ApbE
MNIKPMKDEFCSFCRINFVLLKIPLQKLAAYERNKLKLTFTGMSLDSSVGIAKGYGLDGRGSIFLYCTAF